MSGAGGDIFYNREDMLKLFNRAYVEEIEPLINEVTICGFIYNPRDQKLYFTEGIKKVIGNIYQEGVHLDVLMQYVPNEQRVKINSLYDMALKDLIIGVSEFNKIEHSFMIGAFDKIDVITYAKSISFDNSTYVIGTIVDDSKSVMETAAIQLYSDGVDEYFFTCDMVNNIMYAGNRIVEDFYFESNVIENFTARFQEIMPEDDYQRLFAEINRFVQKGEFDYNSEYRFITPARGDMVVRLNGLSDCDRYGNPGGDNKYVSGSFTDVTAYVKDAEFLHNILDGSSAITYAADLKASTVSFSEKIRDLYPDSELIYTGDIVERLSEVVVPEDRKRFRNVLNRVMDGNLERFSVEVRVNTEDGITWIALRGKTYFDTAKQGNMAVGAVFNLSRMNSERESVEKNDSCDELTGLPTREKLFLDAEVMIRDKNLLSAAVLLIDVKDFHSFNDRYGRSAGNEILIALSAAIQKNLPEGAVLYHIGVDVFAILWPHASRKMVTEFMEFLQEESGQPLDTGRGSFFISIGLSASIYPYSGSDIDELLVNAEIALHKVKQDKKQKYAIYSPVDKRELKERLDFEMQITQSIRNNMENFQLYYQPLIDARTGRLDGAEALLRWVAPNGEIVNPERVVNALESTDQMESVGTWILNEAISQCSYWVKNGAPRNFYVHINVTADDLLRRSFANDVIGMLKNYDLSPRNILIEITETSLMKNLAMSRQNLIKLRSENVRVALDDFGTGYSSFNYLKELPVDEIKIDKTFVDDMETEEFNKSFISAITMLVHSIGMKVVVEGVENENQVNMIRDMGADIFQGYYFSKPLTVFNFENKYFKH